VTKGNISPVRRPIVSPLNSMFGRLDSKFARQTLESLRRRWSYVEAEPNNVSAPLMNILWVAPRRQLSAWRPLQGREKDLRRCLRATAFASLTIAVCLRARATSVSADWVTSNTRGSLESAPGAAWSTRMNQKQGVGTDRWAKNLMLAPTPSPLGRRTFAPPVACDGCDRLPCARHTRRRRPAGCARPRRSAVNGPHTWPSHSSCT
jgi:hypothetical protein